MKVKLVLALVVMLIMACTRKINIEGSYYSKKEKKTFLIKKDSSYNYDYRFEFAHEYSFGTWKEIDRKTVEINSAYLTRILPLYSISSKKVSDLNSTTIILEIPKSLALYYEFIFYLNDSICLAHDSSINSLIKISNIQFLNTISVAITGKAVKPTRFLDTLYSNKFYKRNDDNLFRLGIIYNDSLFNYKIFDSQKIFLKKRGIFVNNIFFKRIT